MGVVNGLTYFYTGQCWCYLSSVGIHWSSYSYSTSGKEKYILYFADVTLGTKIKNSFTKAVIGRIGCLSGHTYNAVKQKNISLCLKRRFYICQAYSYT